MALEFSNVSKRYWRKGLPLFDRRVLWALQDVTFSLPPGEALALIGRNGSGKSTLMRLAAGITQPTKGRVSGPPDVVPALSTSGALLSHFNAEENARFFLCLARLPRHEVDAMVPRILDFAELGEGAEMSVRNFSTGMRARLAFAIVCHMPCSVLVLDEIFATTDANYREKCFSKVDELKARGVSILLATHDFAEVRRICERVIWLENGKVVADGPAHKHLPRYAADNGHV